MARKMIVVDNNEEEANRLIDFFREAFPEDIILPDPSSSKATFGDWQEVFDYINTIADEEAVLCLDLALKDEDYPDVLRGLDKGADIRNKKKKWIILAYTRFGVRAKHEHHFKEAFDGVIDKQEIDPLSRVGRIDFVRRIVQNAVFSRHQFRTKDIMPDVEFIDSLGMRTFRAAFNNAAIIEILQNEAPNWEDTSLKALTTGHSGAFMLSITGDLNGSPQSVVLKIARKGEVIQNEVKAQVTYLSQLGPLAHFITPLDQTEKILNSDTGVYYRQPFIDGKPILEILKRGKWKTHKKALSRVVDLCIDMYKGVKESKHGFIQASQSFKLTRLDISRFENSTSFIIDLANSLKKLNFWPIDTTPHTIDKEVCKLVKNWSEICSDYEFWSTIQHGDLNPGNVLILPDGSPRLIDLSRLGSWPIGYDLSRLAVMLRLRLTDSLGQRDWLHENLIKWCSEPTAFIDKPMNSDKAVCPEAIFCDQAFYQFLLSSPTHNRSLLARGYLISTLWDLIKIVSYQDISAYKKIWALIECWRLGNLLKSKNVIDVT